MTEPKPSGQGKQAQQQQAAGSGSKYRAQFDRGSFEIMQYVNSTPYPCAWVWSPIDQLHNETWIWVTNAPSAPNTVYLVPGDSSSPNSLSWMLSEIPLLPPGSSEAQFIAYVQSRVGPGVTLQGTRHMGVQPFNP